MILITGCARSGTSITSLIMQACGANMGKLNPNGENMIIRDRYVKPYLSANGFDPLCQDVLAMPDKAPPWPELPDIMEGIEAYKDPKICHIWNRWADNFPHAKWVIVRRDKEKIVNSCIRTSFMKKRHNRESWSEWVDQHIERFNEIKEHCNAIEVWPDKAVNGDYSEYKRMIEFVGLEWNEKAEQVINPKKWHG